MNDNQPLYNYYNQGRSPSGPLPITTHGTNSAHGSTTNPEFKETHGPNHMSSETCGRGQGSKNKQRAVKSSAKNPTHTYPKGKKCNRLSDYISVTQINLRHTKGAWGTLLSNIFARRNPIVLVTEPYVETNNLLPKVHKDLVPFYYKKGDARPRAAILIHKSLADKCWELPQFTTKDQIAIKINHDSKDIILVSSYMDGTIGNVPPTEMTPLVDYAKQHNLPIVISSDTNSQHCLWGNKKNNQRGEDLLDYLDSHELTWSNRGSSSTFFNTRGHSSIIDLTITNRAAEDLVQDWHVSSKFSNSDHCYIFYEIKSSAKHEPKQVRIAKNTNWESFRENLILDQRLKSLNQKELRNDNDLDQAAIGLNQILIESFEAACPITYISSSIKKPPWLTAEVEEAQRGVRHQLMKARSVKTEPEWVSYRKRARAYEKLKKFTKKSGWREFCKNTESVRESARMNKILKSSSNKKEKLETLYKSDNSLTTNPEETLTVLEETHFKEGGVSDLRNPPLNTTTTPDSLLNKIYDSSRLSDAVKSFVPEKAAGPDGIQPILIQQAWDQIAVITRKIMQTSHRLCHVPLPWKESNAIFVAKPGKTDYYRAKSYRPITLSPVLLKLQEKVILWHMQFDLNMTSLTSERQFGFKKGSSTETALHKVAHKIEKWIARKGYVLGTFLDIEGAFDNVSFSAISTAINKSPVDQSTAGWITSMVTNRYITISHKNASKRIRVKRGCPQGGILSPFLWNLIVDDLLKFTMNALPAYLQAFADDLVALAEGKDLDHMRASAQKTINTIERWCKSKGLNISALKTKIVLFTWKKDQSLPIPLKVGGRPIELSNSVKFLGVTLDSKLTFNEHIDNITRKATATLMQCKRAVGPTWGLTPKTCLWIYTVVVRPVLSYASVIWVNALNKQYNVKKLERVQALALRISTGAMPNTDYEALDHITGTPRIESYLKGEAAKGASRLQAYKDWTRENPSSKGTIMAHSTINNGYIEDLQLPNLVERDLTKPILTLLKKYKLDISEEADLSAYRKNLGVLIKEIPANTIACYTDGSKTEQGTGFGYIVTTHNNNTEIMSYSAKLPDCCTVYQAELAAIRSAAEALSIYDNKDIIILTDSRSALQSLNTTTLNSKTAIECHGALNGLAASNIVALKWVAGHEGHWGNEKADILAKKGTSCDNLVKGYLPQSLIKQRINQKVRDQDAKAWANSGHRHSKMTLGKKHLQILKDMKKLLKDRIGYRAAVQLITGHAGLNDHLYKMKLVNSKTCPLCESGDETVGHFLGQCPALSRLRGDTFNSFYASMTDIFESHGILKIVGFAKKSKRLQFKEKDHSGVT